MNQPKATMAQLIAQVAIAFEQRRTGNHGPKSVTVVLSAGTLVITLHEALSPAEKALAKTPAGAAQKYPEAEHVRKPYRQPRTR